MLEQWKGAGFLRNVVEIVATSPAFELEPDRPCRLFDRLTEIALVHRSNQELPGEKCGQGRILGAAGVEVGAHGQDHDGWAVRDRGGVDEIRDELRSLLVVGSVNTSSAWSTTHRRRTASGVRSTTRGPAR